MTAPAAPVSLDRDDIQAALPSVRRFARAFTGDATRGDLWVAQALEAVLAGGVDRGADMPRVILLRALLSLPAPEAPSPHGEGGGENEGILLERVQGLDAAARRLLLLVQLEGLPLADVAWILDQPTDAVAEAVEEARQKLYRQPPSRVLIIEDESIIALDLAETVTGLAHEVVGIAGTADEAVALAGRTRPGLVLADIQLADDSSGIDAANEIQAAFGVPVVFVTAFPERLLTGQRPEPAFLVSKPFDSEMLAVAIAQALAVPVRA